MAHNKSKGTNSNDRKVESNEEDKSEEYENKKY